MKRRWITIAHLMVLVALVALDLGVLLNRGFGANPLQLLTVIVVEAGLFRALFQRGGSRSWWTGFAAGALAYVMVDAVFHYEIRYVFIGFCHLAVVKPLARVLLIPVPLPEPLFFGLSAGILQVLAALLVGVIGGRLFSRLAGRHPMRKGSINGTPGTPLVTGP